MTNRNEMAGQNKLSGQIEDVIWQDLLDFFKALSDPERLKIVGLLALEPHTIEQAATRLRTKPANAGRHLEYLLQAGLVTRDGSAYTLDTGALLDRSRSVLAGMRPRVSPDDFEGEAYDRKVLSDYMLPEGRLRAIPTQEKKLLVVLRYIAPSFSPDERYSEKEVNGMLMRYHHDTAFLRRYLVDNGFLGRSKDGREYWRIGE